MLPEQLHPQNGLHPLEYTVVFGYLTTPQVAWASSSWLILACNDSILLASIFWDKALISATTLALESAIAWAFKYRDSRIALSVAQKPVAIEWFD